MSSVHSPLEFFSTLRWLDGTPLLETIEPYRRTLFMRALFTFDEHGTPLYNLCLAGRGKKNWKTADMILAALYKLVIPETVQGNDVLIVASDEDQARDALDLAKKLVACNPNLEGTLDVLAKEIVRCDGHGSIKVLSRDAAGAHGKTAIMVCFDELHTHRDWALLEALQPDPTRPDALTWITSYDVLTGGKGVPLYDLKTMGMKGEDPRMLFSWYSGDYCTDPDLADLEPEERANPSMGSWPEGKAYLEQQKRRLPRHHYRRLHLNLPGAPKGAVYDADVVEAAIGSYKRLPPVEGVIYTGFVDMSGGTHDDSVLAIAHKTDDGVVVDLVEKQIGKAPFDPNDAVRKFADILKEYGVKSIQGDFYAGATFPRAFERLGIQFHKTPYNKTQIYEQFEPILNAGEVDLPDHVKLREQLIGLVFRGTKIDHLPDQYDDHANATAGVVVTVGSATAEVAVTAFDSSYGRSHGPRRTVRMVTDEEGNLCLQNIPNSENQSVAHPVRGSW